MRRSPGRRTWKGPPRSLARSPGPASWLGGPASTRSGRSSPPWVLAPGSLQWMSSPTGPSSRCGAARSSGPQSPEPSALLMLRPQARNARARRGLSS
eukprot:11005028-Alexandrium_andersonii.AAC.1